MSSLLEQAIADAKMLKETARKNAEAQILEHFSDKIKQNIEALLEQEAGVDVPSVPTEEPAAPEMDLSPTLPAPETKKVMDKIPAAYLGEDVSQEVEIDLDTLVEKVESMEKELNVKAPEISTFEERPAVEKPQEHLPAAELAESLEEGTEFEEKVEEALEEEGLEVEETLDEEMQIDIQNTRPGGINMSELEMKKQVAIAKALETQRDALMEQVKERNEAILQLSEHNELLEEKYKTAFSKLKKSVEINSALKENLKKVTNTLNEVNIVNARLLYTNKILGNVSLNERQKSQIAETISKATTVDEAKTIYETLKGTMQTVVEKRTVPQSLSEAVQRAPSPFLPRNNNPSADPIAERWKLIAGIKK
jgi:hypothetical protein